MFGLSRLFFLGGEFTKLSLYQTIPHCYVRCHKEVVISTKLWVKWDYWDIHTYRPLYLKLTPGEQLPYANKVSNCDHYDTILLIALREWLFNGID